MHYLCLAPHSHMNARLLLRSQALRSQVRSINRLSLNRFLRTEQHRGQGTIFTKGWRKKIQLLHYTMLTPLCSYVMLLPFLLESNLPLVSYLLSPYGMILLFRFLSFESANQPFHRLITTSFWRIFWHLPFYISSCSLFFHWQWSLLAAKWAFMERTDMPITRWVPEQKWAD